MVGVSAALHLQRRGRDVALIDRRAPGEETSYGNAGLIQREAVIPYTFPREFGVVLKPVECVRRPIENNSSRGQVVYDPFCGSGTTIIPQIPH
jgi:glycine/D-amino acid oxidase-like deaminating enzyme